MKLCIKIYQKIQFNGMFSVLNLEALNKKDHASI